MPATVLVADDNSNIQRMVTLELQGQGFRVIAVGNGEAAVRKITELHPDLVLADVFMPVRTGYEVCEFVKKNEALAGIPVVLLIGAFDPLDEGEVQRVRADGVLKKPFVPPDPLVLTVKQLLERSGVSTAKPASGKAGRTAPSSTVAAPTFDFVGNDHMPAAFVPPTPPVPRPYPAEPSPTPATIAQAKPTEPATRIGEKVEEEEPTPQDWITRPEPITYLGREEEKPLVFSDLLEETSPTETAHPLTPEEETREFLKEKTSPFYDFDALETSDSQTTVAEPRPGGPSPELPGLGEEIAPTETVSEAAGVSRQTEGGLVQPARPTAREEWVPPAETESPSLPGADQGIPPEAAWESSPAETDASNPAAWEESPMDESEFERDLEEMPAQSAPPPTGLQGWLQETFLLGPGMPGRAISPTESAKQAEAPFAPPPPETEPVPFPSAQGRHGEPVVQPLEVSESALEELSEPPEPPEEVTLDSQLLASQLVGTEEDSFAPRSGVAQEPVHGKPAQAFGSEAQVLDSEARTRRARRGEPVPDFRKTEEAGEPIEEIPMEREWAAEEASARPPLQAANGAESETGRVRGEELHAPFEENLIDQPFEADESPSRLGEAEEPTTPERFWSEPKPAQVEDTTESIRTEPFATESLVTEAPSIGTPPASSASEESSVAEEPFLTVPVSDELVEAEQPSAYAPAGIGAAFPESEPIGTHHSGEPFLSPAIETQEPPPVHGEPDEGVEPEFQLTPPAGPGPENGELVQKVVEEVMSRLSPDLLEQISRELVKPLTEAVLKRNRPKPD